MQEKVLALVYCMINDQIIDIFMNPLLEAKFVMFHTLLGFQEATITGGCTQLISTP